MSKYDELERLLVEATPAEEWTPGWQGYSDGWQSMGPYCHEECGDKEPERQAEIDARLIVAMRNTLPNLLAERRELRARLLEELALRVGTSDVIDPSLAAGWNDAREGRWAERRAVCLLRHYADGIRTGRIK